MKRKSIAMLAAALCTLAITVTALAAELINAEQARDVYKRQVRSFTIVGIYGVAIAYYDSTAIVV